MSETKLTQTQQTWKVDEQAKTRVYNTPVETGKGLDSHQGKLVLPVQFGGTCGLVSCVNVLRLAGITDITEEEIVSIAIQTKQCTAALDPAKNGGTTLLNRMCILKIFGFDSDFYEPTIQNIARFVTEGRGVIVGVDAGILWQDVNYLGGGHAITVTSVKTDLEGNILGFYICDSGRGEDADSARFITLAHMRSALLDEYINVTRDIIR